MVTTPTQNISKAIEIGELRLKGSLAVPQRAKGVVIFCHGSGSSRLSPRNTWVADQLESIGIGTLLFDLLTETEAEDRANVFDVKLLGDRVCEALLWLQNDSTLSGLPVGLFGASTGAAAALLAAARHPKDVVAVVSRGGRPDLAAANLARVQAPTLLIVGAADPEVIALNEQAFDKLTCKKRIAIVPHATHLFEEPGTLDKVVELAGNWFDRFFTSVQAETRPA